jgi:hypothetical protein
MNLLIKIRRNLGNAARIPDIYGNRALWHEAQAHRLAHAEAANQSARHLPELSTHRPKSTVAAEMVRFC